MKVKQAAIRDDDGKVWTLPRPARHHTILRHMNAHGKPGSFIDGQGFILDDGTFARRKPAAIIAIRAGQIEKCNWGSNLYSEDLW